MGHEIFRRSNGREASAQLEPRPCKAADSEEQTPGRFARRCVRVNGWMVCAASNMEIQNRNRPTNRPGGAWAAGLKEVVENPRRLWWIA